VPDHDQRQTCADDGTTTFPVVRSAQGGPSPDGRALLIEGLTAGGGSVRFALSLAEVQHFVAFLLVSVGKIGTLKEDPGISELEAGNCRPIPVTSVAIGEPQGDQGYLGIAVGQAELVFAIPLSSFDPIGRTMLTASVLPDASPSA
jgi:hypothetical protein